MGQAMTYQTVVRAHPNKFIIAVVNKRHPDTNVAVLFKVLQTTVNVEKLRKVYNYYRDEGFEDVIPISSYLEDDDDASDMPPDLSAKFFKTYYNM